MVVPGLVKWGAISTSQVMVLILFGTNALLFVIFQFLTWRNKLEEIATNSTSHSVEDREEGVELLERQEREESGEDHKNPLIKDTDTQSSLQKATPHAVSTYTKPYTGTFECCLTLTTELFRTSILMLFTFICERHWYLEHSGKEYSRDHFLFILFLFFLYAFYTIKPIRDHAVLGREQTEEWKGWMQFIFLLYHYFHAEEVYNSVRVMITCYVWMTGFGNFSFFYIKQDFGWLRLIQMMWRLNFSVLLLMWTHGNTWILYYICPMHTFYFLMVFLSMYIYKSVNHTKYGIRHKLVVLGIVIYIIWDINGGIFDAVFALLGTDKVIGANSGSVWEYYFRTSLDHWSSYLGMIFALNYPLIEQYYKFAAGLPLYFAATVMFVLTIAWLFIIYTKPKMEYNLLHSYTAIVPLVSYIFFRNISLGMRSFVSMSLHDLGKTTLETYLLQHHIWLTSNAKTLLTWIPNHPYINFAFATFIFFVVSKELYRLTMSIRGLVLPDDASTAKTNIFGMCTVLIICYSIAFGLVDMDIFGTGTGNGEFYSIVFIVCCFLALLVCQALARFNTSTRTHSTLQSHSRNITMVLCGMLVLGALLHMSARGGGAFGINGSGSSSSNAAMDISTPLLQGSGPGVISGLPSPIRPACAQLLSQGKWIVSDCNTHNRRTLSLPLSTQTSNHDHIHSHSRNQRRAATSSEALCESNKWLWADSSSSGCPTQPTKISRMRAHILFADRVVTFMGDSVVRQTYHQFVSLLDAAYDPIGPISFDKKHMDLKFVSTNGAIGGIGGPSKVTVQFLWAPFVSNITDILRSTSTSSSISVSNPAIASDFIVAGGGLWDALHGRSKSTYENELSKLASAWSSLKALRNRGNTLPPIGSGLVPPSSSLVSVTRRPVPVYVWLQPTTILDARLSPEKAPHMNEQIISTYRQAVVSALGKGQEAGAEAAVDVILDATDASESRVEGSMDGIHFVDNVYQVIAQMVANAYGLRYPSRMSSPIANTSIKVGLGSSSGTNKSPYVAKITGSMSFPGYGILVLTLSIVMLYGMDNFLGIGYLSLLIFGKTSDWEAAYAPLHKKLGISAAGVSTGGEPAGASGADVSPATLNTSTSVNV